MTQRIAVIGGGIIGLTSAYELSRAGHQITVFEAQDEVAQRASFGNAGLICGSSAEPWATPGAIRAAVSWLFRADAPLKVHLGWDWDRIKWLAGFVASARNHEANTRAMTQIALAARAPLLALAQDTGADFDMAQRGVIDLYGTPADLKKAETSMRWMQEEGLERDLIDAETLAALEPSLPRAYPGAIFTPRDITGCSQKLCVALVKALEDRGGKMRMGTSVQDVRPAETSIGLKISGAIKDFDQVVIANGMGAEDFAPSLGERFGIYGVKGYSLTLDLTAPEHAAAAPTRGLLDHDHKIAASRLGNRFRVAGTAEIGAKSLSLDPERLRPIGDWIKRTFPDLRDAPRTPWAGFRPMRAAMLPYVGASARHSRLFYNVGHGHLGWTNAAGSAQTLAALIQGTGLSN